MTDNMIPLTWSNWIPLEADLVTYQEHIPNAPGFYQVRATGRNSLAYIGQTGRSLRLRTRAELAKHVLRPIESPPWNDPHTAAPLLWAFRHEDSMEFELSVAVADLDVQMRQCYEDVLLYLHRLEFGRSTLCNHGRRHPWWSRASNRKDARPAHRLSVPVEYPSLQISSGDYDSFGRRHERAMSSCHVLSQTAIAQDWRTPAKCNYATNGIFCFRSN
jgi:hypothetical protein